MANYKGSQDKIVDSEYLFKQFSNFDKRRAKKLYDSLFVKEHYALNNVDGKYTIVGSGLLVNSDIEVEIDTVTAKLLPDDVYSYQLGDKVDLIPEQEIYLKAATLNHESEDLDLDTLDQIVP